MLSQNNKIGICGDEKSPIGREITKKPLLPKSAGKERSVKKCKGLECKRTEKGLFTAQRTQPETQGVRTDGVPCGYNESQTDKSKLCRSTSHHEAV